MLYNDATSLESFLDNREIWDSWMKDTVTSPKQMYVDPLETMHKLVVDRKNNGSYGIESGGEEPWKGDECSINRIMTLDD